MVGLGGEKLWVRRALGFGSNRCLTSNELYVRASLPNAINLRGPPPYRGVVKGPTREGFMKIKMRQLM